MGFWLAAGAITLAVAALLARAILRGGRDSHDASDLDVYRDQLAEVDRDRARGVIDEAEAERLRVEVSRRLLDADRNAHAGTIADEPRPVRTVGALVVAVAVVAAGLGLYTALGAPGYPDLPIAQRIAAAEEARRSRPGQQMAEAEAALMRQPVEPAPQHAELMDRLRATLEERPDDVEGYMLLARNEAGLGNFVAARRAQERVLDLRGDGAAAADWADYALYLVYAAGGYVSPEAEAAVSRVLRRDPANGTARYLTGLMHAQTGRPDLAYRVWNGLLAEGPRDAPWAAPIRNQIERVAQLAGVEHRPVPQLSSGGPSEADVAAAADMTPEEQQQMIRGMVEGLAGRLAEAGGPAEDWARLISALGVLGEDDRALEIYAEAREAFGANAEDLALIDAAAERAGIAQ